MTEKEQGLPGPFVPVMVNQPDIMVVGKPAEDDSAN